MTIAVAHITQRESPELTMSHLEILNSIEAPVWVLDVDHSSITWANQCAIQHWNAGSLEELQSRDLSNDMSDNVHLRLQQYLTDAELSDHAIYDEWTIYPNNVPKTMRMAFSKYALDDGRTALLVQILDTQIDATPGVLHSMQALMHTSAMISVFDVSLDLIYANPAARKTFGKRKLALSEYIANESDLKQILKTFEAKGSYCDELMVDTQYGQCWHAMNIQISPDPVNAGRTILVSATDVTEKRRVQQAAIDQAYTDPLTGLPNRLALLNKIKGRINNYPDVSFALLFFDLDRFKLVNDTLGHAVGDSLLNATATLLKQAAGKNNLVTRLSGDEFVLLVDHSDPVLLEKIIGEILKLSHVPMKIDGYSLRISPSIGVSTYPQDGKNDTELLQHADIAMHTAKSLACRFRFFNPDMGKSNRNRLSLESDLAEAITSNQFELFYQPKVDAQNFNIVEMEALIRWQHPTRGLVSPLDFIPIAEETGMIFDIGDWVIQQALLDQSRWEKLGYDISVAVNVSPKQFTSPDFLDRLRLSLSNSECKPQMLNVEITESSLVGDENNVQHILSQLSSDGIRISIDDFGTGYSNLANLHKYPIHCLKIDRAFLKDDNDTALLTTILEMGKIMNMTVVAEGVETVEQIQWLREHQCDQLQGFFFSKPIPFDSTLEYLRNYRQTLQETALAA